VRKITLHIERMYTSTIDITIRTINSLGEPTSAPALYGIVHNIRGEQVDVLTLERLIESAPGVYNLDDYSVSDTNTFPGTELTIFWCTQSTTVSPETALQRYALFAKHPSGVVNRLLTWYPSYRRNNLYGYRIYRQLRGEETPTVLGQTIYPYFFDRSVYTTPTEFHLARFTVYELAWLATPTDEPIEGGAILMLRKTETRHSFCEVYGEVVDVMGGSSAESVNFFVHEKDAPQTVKTSFMARRDAVTAPVNCRGEFSIPLIQGALVTADMPEAGVQRRFVVPNKARVALKDITHYPVEINRAE